VQRILGSMAIAAGLLSAAPGLSRAADTPTPIIVAEFDYRDTSGEARDQEAEHVARLRRFAAFLREELERSGKYRPVAFACPEEPCSAGHSDPAELIEEARRAGAALILYGGVQKMSTLVQNVKVEMVDVASNRLVFQRWLTFRGDTDDSWERTSRFVVRDLVAAEISR
jgi:hypothetical protein